MSACLRVSLSAWIRTSVLPACSCAYMMCERTWELSSLFVLCLPRQLCCYEWLLCLCLSGAKSRPLLLHYVLAKILQYFKQSPCWLGLDTVTPPHAALSSHGTEWSQRVTLQLSLDSPSGKMYLFLKKNILFDLFFWLITEISSHISCFCFICFNYSVSDLPVKSQGRPHAGSQSLCCMVQTLTKQNSASLLSPAHSPVHLYLHAKFIKMSDCFPLPWQCN